MDCLQRYLWQAPLILLAILFCHGFHYDGDLDPYNVDNTFHMDCGNVSLRRMHMMFRGDAYKVFSATNASCVAEEVEPGHFQILDAFKEPSCMPQKTKNVDLFSMEIIIQKGLVSQYNDPHHVVTCNYEIKGKGGSSQSVIDDSIIERTPQMVQVRKEIAKANFTIFLANAKGKKLVKIEIGSYIQMVVEMTVIAGSEESFRPWNCRVFAHDTTGKLQEHFILLEGCGDGDVIKRNRGFKIETNNVTVHARSVYFRAFGLSGSKYLKFECDFVVTPTLDALGPSCFNSPAGKSVIENKEEDDHDHKHRRKRRAVGTGGLDFEDMPYSQSRWYRLVSNSQHKRPLFTYTVDEDTDFERPSGLDTGGFGSVPSGSRYKKNNPAWPSAQYQSYPFQYAMGKEMMPPMTQYDKIHGRGKMADSIMITPTFFLGLIIVLSVMTVLLIVVAVFAAVICYRLAKKKSNENDPINTLVNILPKYAEVKGALR